MDIRGNQRITDTGPLTTKRMETVDEEFLDRTKRFITQATEAKEQSRSIVSGSPDEPGSVTGNPAGALLAAKLDVAEFDDGLAPGDGVVTVSRHCCSHHREYS